MQRADSAVRTVKSVVAVSRERHVTTLAASLAYYAFNAFVPTLFLFVVGIATFGSADAVSQGLGRLVGTDPGRYERILETLGAQTSARFGALSLAVAIVIWSSFRSLRSFQDTFADVYGNRRHTSFWGRIRDTAIAFAAVTTALVVVSFVSGALSVLLGGLWSLASAVLVFAALVAVFLPMYYLFPGTDIPLREAVPGAVVAAVAWSISGIVFRVYVRVAGSVELYGLAGAVLIFLSWLYFGGLALLVGVVLNAVLADRVDADYRWLPSVPSAPDRLRDDEEREANP